MNNENIELPVDRSNIVDVVSICQSRRRIQARCKMCAINRIRDLNGKEITGSIVHREKAGNIMEIPAAKSVLVKVIRKEIQFLKSCKGDKKARA